jgi:hypothetical protein
MTASDERKTALRQGTAGLLAAVVLFPAGLMLAGAIQDAGSNLRAGAAIGALSTFGSLACTVFAAWKLGLARDHRFDGAGFLALGLLLPCYLLLFLLIVYAVMIGTVLVTGQPFTLFGD